jgi:hypothetical protein
MEVWGEASATGRELGLERAVGLGSGMSGGLGLGPGSGMSEVLVLWLRMRKRIEAASLSNLG